MIHNFLKSLIGQKIRQILESKNFKLEDKHLGEECYIFGDGVSIQHYDLENFNDKIGIACNHFPFHKDFKKTKISQTDKDALQVMELDDNVKWEKIHLKFKELVKKYHPDKNQGSKKFEEKLKKITLAYSQLKKTLGKK